MFANHISDKGLAFRMQKEFPQLNNRRTTQFQKQTRDRSRHSQGIWLANKKIVKNDAIREK